MTAKLIDGKAIAEAVRREAAEETARLKALTGQVPTLAAVLVGENPASQTYVAPRARRAKRPAWVRSPTGCPPRPARQRWKTWCASSTPTRS